ncbi:MAG: site-specific integrase [Burkholderiaceae bacterium]
MLTLARVIDAFASARTFDRGTLSRLEFWNQQLGDRDFATITEDDIDAATMVLLQRDRLQAGRGRRVTQPSGQPISPATLNRYRTQYESLVRFARKSGIVSRKFVSPTKGIERYTEKSDPNRYLRAPEIERILAQARVLDRRWGRMTALIVMAWHCGLRKGNLLALRWADVDLITRTVTVVRTKNGDALTSPLSTRCMKELATLPVQHPQALVFGNRFGQAFSFKNLWAKCCTQAGLPGRNFHQLRHACGSELARQNIGQAAIMSYMGHRSLRASARYMHLNVDDRRAVTQKVFG